MGNELVHLTFRKENGQIGYMTKGITIPEFYELVQPSIQNINITNNNILIDFYPIIDKLNSLYNQQKNDEVYIKSQTLYNYWKDGRTFKKESIVISRFNEISKMSNELLNILKLNLKQKPSKSVHNPSFGYRDLTSYQYLNLYKQYLENVDIYIKAILIYIHSKASLEMESFKKDEVLTNYINDLYSMTYDLYERETDFLIMEIYY